MSNNLLEIAGEAFNYLPAGYTLLKDLDSRDITGNTKTARLFGFKNNDQLCGISDYDINCEASKYADLFITQDKKLIAHNNELVILVIHPYVQGEYKSLIINKP